MMLEGMGDMPLLKRRFSGEKAPTPSRDGRPLGENDAEGDVGAKTGEGEVGESSGLLPAPPELPWFAPCGACACG